MNVQGTGTRRPVARAEEPRTIEELQADIARLRGQLADVTTRLKEMHLAILDFQHAYQSAAAFLASYSESTRRGSVDLKRYIDKSL